MSVAAAQITGVAAGVPFVAVPPSSGPRAAGPVVVAWHPTDAPRTEVAFAAAMPLTGLDAWRIYLGLPMCGSRTPDGGLDELMRLGYEDAVMNLQGPIVEQAVGEFAPALADLRDELELGDGPLGVLGGSIGAAVAQRVIVEGDVRIDAAVLVSPLVRLRAAVDAMAVQYGFTYSWSDEALAVAKGMDFVARADEIADRGQPAVLLVLGAEDDVDGFREPAAQLRDALAARYAEPGRVQLETVAGMGHALAEEPGLEPAHQTAHAAAVETHTVRWLNQHLPGL